MMYAALLAQVNPLDLGRNFRAAERDFQWANVVLLIAIIAAVGFAIWLAVRFASEGEKRGYRSPRRMFRELCHAHQLDRTSRRLLKRLGAAHRLAPMRLFLEPERFDPSQLGGSWAGQRPQLELLRDRIFGRRLKDEARSTPSSVSV